MENSVTTATSTLKLKRDPVKVILASMMGTAIEFLTFMPTELLRCILSKGLFPADDAATGDQLSLLTLVASLPVRFVLVCHYGDWLGRKKPWLFLCW